MFKVNILNVSIWILGGILLLFLLGVILWRVFKKNDNKKQQVNQDNIVISNKIKDLSLSLGNVYDIQNAVNILFKNRFSKTKYSAIPILAINKNKNMFLIANPIKFSAKNKYIIDEKQNIVEVFKSNKQKTVLIYSRYRDIIKYINSFDAYPELIIPFEGQKPNIDGHNFIATNELGQYIKQIQVSNKNNTKIFNNLHKVNIYKSKSVLGGKNV